MTFIALEPWVCERLGPELGEWLSAARHLDGDPAELLDDVIARRAVLIVIVAPFRHGDKLAHALSAVCVAYLVDSALEVRALVGAGLRDWIDELERHLEALAKDQSADTLRVKGRPGWRRVLGRRGWQWTGKRPDGRVTMERAL